MAFNHYARLQRIVATLEPGWYIVRIDEPTRVQNFKGEKVEFNHYYRLYNNSDNQVKFGKFQQIERFAKAVSLQVEALPIIEN